MEPAEFEISISVKVMMKKLLRCQKLHSFQNFDITTWMKIGSKFDSPILYTVRGISHQRALRPDQFMVVYDSASPKWSRKLIYIFFIGFRASKYSKIDKIIVSKGSMAIFFSVMEKMNNKKNRVNINFFLIFFDTFGNTYFTWWWLAASCSRPHWCAACQPLAHRDCSSPQAATHGTCGERNRTSRQ